MTTYSHDAHAGGRSDVWKHMLLLRAVRCLARRHRRPAVFRYLESHCGKALYVLPPQGEWQNGVGRICGEPPARGEPYTECLGAAMGSRSIYFGSWMLVALYLQRLGHRFVMRISDSSSEVACHIRTILPKSRRAGSICFRHVDGYRELAVRRDAHLSFLDPPYGPAFCEDVKRSAKAVNLLLLQGRPFLAYYPIYEGRDLRALINQPGTIRLELVWGPNRAAHRGGVAGCGILANQGLADAFQSNVCGMQLVAEQLRSQLFLFPAL